MHDTAIQIILILHDSGVLCKLHILDRELDHFSYPVLLHNSNAVFTHKISCCQMQCITQMQFSHIRFHFVKCNASLLCKQIAMIRDGFFTV